MRFEEKIWPGPVAALLTGVLYLLSPGGVAL